MSFLTNLWAKVVAKLGTIGQFLGVIAEEIHVAIKEKDVVKAKAATAKAREKANDVLDLCDAVDDALDDGILTAVEGSELALKIEALVD